MIWVIGRKYGKKENAELIKNKGNDESSKRKKKRYMEGQKANLYDILYTVMVKKFSNYLRFNKYS